MNKIEKIISDIEKTKVKISELQNRLRELERQKKETENAEIVLLVRGLDVAPEKLRELLAACHPETTQQETTHAAPADIADAAAGKEETDE